MDKRFADLVAELDPAYRRLLAMAPRKPLELPRGVPQAGIYLLSESRRHLYVGRSNRIRERLSNHCRESATHRTAAFAFRLAREATGHTRATYRPQGSRADLMRNPAFAKAFEAAKARIRAMDVRFVEETDPTRQCVLEVYVAVVLQTPYNNFDTH